MMKWIFVIVLLFTLSLGIGFFPSCNESSGTNWKQVESGIVVNTGNANLRVQVCTPNIIHVVYKPIDSLLVHKSLIAKEDWKKVYFRVKEIGEKIIISTSQMRVVVDLNEGKITFFNKKNESILTEGKYRKLSSANVMGEKTYHILQSFIVAPDDSFYGLGQQQDGFMNYRNKSVTLVQTNTVAINPFLISTGNYGILWDNYSKTIFQSKLNEISFWSEVGNIINYYFVSGPNMDQIIAGYREITGETPMYGKWAYGYWQSKERYVDANDLTGVAREYRKRKIPIDNMVQDWRYWGDNDHWSSMRFDSTVWPHPEKTIRYLHDSLNMHLMISIWPALGIKTEIFKEMNKKGFLYPPEHWTGGKLYDAYSMEARELYWKYIKDGLVSKGIDALWMDGTEPELRDQHTFNKSEKYIKEMEQNDLGSMARYLNTFSLETSRGVYEGFRKDVEGKRVFILTRSAFAGQQKYAAATWSGDISSNWKTFKNQISAGLNFCMSGLPYWTTDIGGFFPSSRGGLFKKGAEDPAFREFYVRWFQFGAFCPLFRAHGTGYPRELWRFGEPGETAYEALLKYDRLRYRLMPYIYSLAWQVKHSGYTIMRGLPMDFSKDKKVLKLNTQYMFGPAFMVVPVVAPLCREPGKGQFPSDVHCLPLSKMWIYLPEGSSWYDFWTGELHSGGQEIMRDVPLDIMPLYVKAGSILLLGPDLQFATEKPANPIEVRIYPGNDGSFTLYEDENDGYNYEKGVYSTIQFFWDNSKSKLIIDKRSGEFPGMLKEREFRIVLVGKSKGITEKITSVPDETVHYTGNRISITIR